MHRSWPRAIWWRKIHDLWFFCRQIWQQFGSIEMLCPIKKSYEKHCHIVNLKWCILFFNLNRSNTICFRFCAVHHTITISDVCNQLIIFCMQQSIITVAGWHRVTCKFCCNCFYLFAVPLLVIVHYFHRIFLSISILVACGWIWRLALTKLIRLSCVLIRVFSFCQ